MKATSHNAAGDGLRPRLLALILAAAFAPAHAQQGPNPLPAPEQIDSIVVLGSARHDATVLTSSAPVDVITPAQLKETGAVTLNQALAQLHPSFNFPQGQNAVKGQGVRSASLRGVSPAYTLVLVNGKRRNASAQLTGTDPWPAATVVDLNAIPITAVSRIEVLRDGAAAQYGSDAIAGVINIVLRENSAGGEVNAHLGGYTDGGGHTSDVSVFKGLHLGEAGFLTLSAQRLKNTNVDRSEADWRQLFPNGDPRNDTFGKKYGQWGQAERDNKTALANAELPLGERFTAYGYVNYANKESSNWVNPERVVKAVTGNPTVTDGTKLGENDVLALYPNGYQPWLSYRAADVAAVAGVRYDDAAFGKLDIALSYGNDETKRDTYNTANPAYGAASPTHFYLGSWKSDTSSLTADWVRNADAGLAEPVAVTAGLLARHEHWRTGDFGDAAGYTGGPLAGKTVGSLYPGTPYAADTSRIPTSGSSTSGIKPEDATDIKRNVLGAYVGADAQVTKQWQVGATGRYEHYSDFGSTRNFRLTSRYDVTPWAALRGTISSGFHAPSLAALGYQSTGTTSNWSNTGTGVLTPGQTRQFRPADPAAAAFGAKPLQPERSHTFSLGAVLRDDDRASLTIDAYRLKVNDVIIATETLQGPTVSAAFNAAGLAGFTQASYYANGWDSRTDGVDIIGRRQWKLAGGQLELSAALSLLNTEVENVHRTVNVGGAQILAIGGAKVRDAATGTPKNKVILGARWAGGPWTVTLETYADASLAYKLNEHWKLDLNIQNLFNHYPDKYILANRASGINPYAFIAPNGASGRFVQAGVSYKF